MYFSIAMEILKVVPDPDVVAVCCGGGGLVAGVAAGLKLSGCKDCRVYAVEPTGGKSQNIFVRKLLYGTKILLDLFEWYTCFKGDLLRSKSLKT
jgi:cysteine synthase